MWKPAEREDVDGKSMTINPCSWPACLLYLVFGQFFKSVTRKYIRYFDEAPVRRSLQAKQIGGWFGKWRLLLARSSVIVMCENPLIYRVFAR